MWSSVLWLKRCPPSHLVSIHGWTHVNCSPGCAVIDRAQLRADAAATHIMPTSSPLAAGLFGTDNYFLDFLRRYLHPSAFKSSSFTHSFSPSLSRLSALFYKQSSDTVSQRHTSSPCPSLLSGRICRDGGHTRYTTYRTRAHTDIKQIQCRVQTGAHKREHCANHQIGRGARERSIWPHLDLTQDTSLTANTARQVCVFVSFCEWVCVCVCSQSFWCIFY